MKSAKYVDLTHTINPSVPGRHGLGPSKFAPMVDPATSQLYTYVEDGFEATHDDLSTDQLGTQFDPPAPWNPYFPAIDELPATEASRPLIVIPIQDQAAKDPGYQMTVEGIRAWGHRNGKILGGSVVFIRSDGSEELPNPELATRKEFPGIKLEVLKFLHRERKMLYDEHRALDTDTTPTLEGQAWLLRNGYTRGQSLANLDKVPEKGPLVASGFPKLQGRTGGINASSPSARRIGNTV